jgi:uncharacterized protein (DUF2235 family)
MPKHLIVCSDGTGNSTIRGRGTNVFKLFEAVDVNGHRQNPRLIRQLAFYDDGVGTEKLKWLRVFSGAVGWGLSRNVRQLYGEIARVYEPGDTLFLFGFSRGAFTVRTLAGMIHDCGILDTSKDACRTEAGFRRQVRAAYRAYRRKYQAVVTALVRVVLPRADADAFKAKYAVKEERPAGAPLIACLGVWDTVDAVGLPFGLAEPWNRLVWRFKFNTCTLGDSVGKAYHALALDDERGEFHPVLWDQRTEKTPGRIEQVWFAGAHSNVGGGYPQHGMSLVTLDWMMARAAACGLRFVPLVRGLYEDQQSAADKLYDPRSGLGVFYRWRPRNVAAMCRRAGIARPKVHVSLLDRVAQGVEGYAPGNIPPDCEVVATGDSLVPLPPLEAVLSELHGGPGASPLLERWPGWIRLGLVSYLSFIGGAILALALAIPTAWQALTREGIPDGFGSWVAWMFGAVGELPIALLKAVFATPVAWRTLVAALVVGWLLSWVSDRALAGRYSEFWHCHRRRLAKALSRGGPYSPSGDLAISRSGEGRQASPSGDLAISRSGEGRQASPSGDLAIS